RRPPQAGRPAGVPGEGQPVPPARVVPHRAGRNARQRLPDRDRDGRVPPGRGGPKRGTGRTKRRIAGVVIVAGLAVVLWAVRERVQTRLTVENRSGQQLLFLQVTLSGETALIRDVPAGAVATATFTIQTDDHFVDGRLADGTPVRGAFGYVMNGRAGERATFVVLPDGRVEFRQTNRISPY